MSPKLAQALHLLAGTTYTERLAGKGSRARALLDRNASDREIMEEFYFAALARGPSAAEAEALGKLMAATPSREQAVQDLAWAIISSREFAENHQERHDAKDRMLDPDRCPVGTARLPAGRLSRQFPGHAFRQRQGTS